MCLPWLHFYCLVPAVCVRASAFPNNQTISGYAWLRILTPKPNPQCTTLQCQSKDGFLLLWFMNFVTRSSKLSVLTLVQVAAGCDWDACWKPVPKQPPGLDLLPVQTARLQMQIYFCCRTIWDFMCKPETICLGPLQDRSLRAMLCKSVAVASVYPQEVLVLIQQKYALPFRPGTCSNNHSTICLFFFTYEKILIISLLCSLAIQPAVSNYQD